MPILFEIRDKREQIIDVASRYNVTKIKVFGSVVREEESGNSDIDFLVDCKEECSLFDLIALKEELQEMLKRKIDLVTEQAIHWSLRDKITGEAKEI